MAAGRTLHVRCSTWEQVETFYTRKLRRGKLLSMRVPFSAVAGAQVTLGLELPNRTVIAIEGRIQRTSPVDEDASKTWIEIELVGFTDEIVERIKAQLAEATEAAWTLDEPEPAVGAVNGESSVPVAIEVAPSAPVAAAREGSAPVAAAAREGSAPVAAAAREGSVPVAVEVAPSAPVAAARERSAPVAVARERSAPAAAAATARERSAPVAVARERSAPVAVARERSAPVAVARERSAPVAAARERSSPVAAARPPGTPIARAFADGSADLAGTRRPALRPLQEASYELPTDERQLFMHLTGELRRLRQLAVHQILDIDRDADPDAVRLGWMRLVRRFHPDLVARYHAPAISHLAEELTILCNRAYDRLRAALVLEGRATAAGSVLQPPAGWLVGFDDISSRENSSRVRAPIDAAGAADEMHPADLLDLPAEVALPSVMVDFGLAGLDTGQDPSHEEGESPSVVQGGATFENRARLMLSNGDALDAQEVLAAALCVYPRSRPLRSLYYVASALAALMKGERMLATSQLETALAHYEHCVEAAQILEYIRKNAHADHAELRRFFR